MCKLRRIKLASYLSCECRAFLHLIFMIGVTLLLLQLSAHGVELLKKFIINVGLNSTFKLLSLK